MTGKTTGVRRVGVVSTGKGRAHPEHLYGTKKPALWWILRSKEWVEIPINVYVIEHASGLVLFDTGVDPKAATDPEFWPDPVTRFINNRVFAWDLGPGDSLDRQLTKAGYSPADVTVAAISHLHFDHAGGISLIPQADLYVAKEAWDHMLGRLPAREGVLRRDLVIPDAKWHHYDFEPTTDPDLAPFDKSCDLLGDGSMIVLPTPGHLPGSVSMLVRRNDGPPLLLIGDLSYSQELLMRDQLPGTGDHELLLDSFAKVRWLKKRIPDLVILAAHDTSAHMTLARVEEASTAVGTPAPSAV